MLPTPVSRSVAAPDEEYLGLSTDSRQPGPLGPIPRLKEDGASSKGYIYIPSVVPEFRVHQAALYSNGRTGEERMRHERIFLKCFQTVREHAVARFRVRKSPIQVCVCEGERVRLRGFACVYHTAVGVLLE